MQDKMEKKIMIAPSIMCIGMARYEEYFPTIKGKWNCDDTC